MIRNMPVIMETPVQSLSWKDPLEKGIATHSSILAWRMLWPEKPGELWSIGLQSRTLLKQLSIRALFQLLSWQLSTAVALVGVSLSMLMYYYDHMMRLEVRSSALLGWLGCF